MFSKTITRSQRGVSMLEVTLLLGVLVILSAAAAPSILRVLQQARHDAAHDEMRVLHESIVGDPGATTFGFVGDLGRVPFELTELGDASGNPLFVLAEDSGVGYGWNGPYVNRGASVDDYRIDPWGQPYDIGVAGFGQLRSAGPNGLFDDADDIVYPPQPLEPAGTLLVSIKGHSNELVISDPDSCVVTLHYSDSGSPASVIDDTVPYSFSGVHRGLHALDVACPRLDIAAMAIESTVVAVRGGGAQQAAVLHVELGALAAVDQQPTAPGAGPAAGGEPVGDSSPVGGRR